MTPEKLQNLNAMMKEIRVKKEYVDSISDAICYLEKHPDQISIIIGRRTTSDYDIQIENNNLAMDILEKEYVKQSKILEDKIKYFNEE